MAEEQPALHNDGAAEALALLAHGTLDSRAAAAYLEKQGRLADLQSQSLIEQNAFELSHLRWRRFGDQMSGALQTMLAAIVLLLVAGLVAAIWNAANDNGLVVEAFSVPPDLAAKGLTGEVIASKVLDRLSEFQAQTVSIRAAASYASNWGGDIKVQIPNTGVSIGEFNRALHQWLGHETRISGEVYRTPGGIAISARVAGQSTPAFKADEGDIDALIQQAAERIYRVTQPYRYASWLGENGRLAEADAVLKSIIETGDARERAWAYNGLAHDTIITGDVARASGFARKAIASDPSILLPQENLAGGESYMGHDEAALSAARLALRTAEAGDPTFAKPLLAGSILNMRLQIAESVGDFAGALNLARKREATGDREDALQDEMVACALLHDRACARATAQSLEPATNADAMLLRQTAMQQADIALEQWPEVLNAAPAFHAGLQRNPFIRGIAQLFDAPLRALALANSGDTKDARAAIGNSLPDCVECLRVRGRIDAIDRNWSGAAYWYAKASQAAPSIPFADADWGAMLLAKGDFDAAIAKFESANKKGPHFADPLEMWGEALIGKNRSDLALAKFAEANRYAPNWGRLHLKWAEALFYAGMKDGAKKQFAVAGNLGLSTADRAELGRVSHG